MPIPVPTAKETQDEFIERCIPEIIGEYSEDGQAYSVCLTSFENATQGGVVGSFGRTKFEFEPKHKETMNEFMARCMSDSTVREKKSYRPTRAGFCYSSYQNRYINNIGKSWK
jgi:hypothetical protein